MSASPEQIAALRAFVGAPASWTDAQLGAIYDRADADVANLIGTVTTVPDPVKAGVTIEVAAELFHRKAAPSGISQFADANGNPIRVARDPLQPAYKELAPYIGYGIG